MVNVWGVVDPHSIFRDAGARVNDIAGGVSTILIFLNLTVFVPPLFAGNAVTSKVDCTPNAGKTN